MRSSLSVGLCLAAGLLSCSGTRNVRTQSGTTQADLRTSPVGVAAMQFLDMMALRADLLDAANLPEGIVVVSSSDASTTYGVNLPAANTGTLTGTVAVTRIPDSSGPGSTYHATLALDVAAVASDPAQSTWHYACTETIHAIPGAPNQAQVLFPGLGQSAPCVLTLTQGTGAAATTQVFQFNANLTETWTELPPVLTLEGTYAFTQTAGQRGLGTVTGILGSAQPVTWNLAQCLDFPNSGLLQLTYQQAGGSLTDRAQASFNSGCGQVTLIDNNGVSYNLSLGNN